MSVLNSAGNPTKAATVIGPDPETFEMDDSTLIANEEDTPTQQPAAKGMLAGVARHTVGLILLLCVVFLWTLSNFLGSVCTADSSRQYGLADSKGRAFSPMTVMPNHFS